MSKFVEKQIGRILGGFQGEKTLANWTISSISESVSTNRSLAEKYPNKFQSFSSNECKKASMQILAPKASNSRIKSKSSASQKNPKKSHNFSRILGEPLRPGRERSWLDLRVNFHETRLLLASRLGFDQSWFLKPHSEGLICRLENYMDSYGNTYQIQCLYVLTALSVKINNMSKILRSIWNSDIVEIFKIWVRKCITMSTKSVPITLKQNPDIGMQKKR